LALGAGEVQKLQFLIAVFDEIPKSQEFGEDSKTPQMPRKKIKNLMHPTILALSPHPLF
jgi:hypothetical protein